MTAGDFIPQDSDFDAGPNYPVVFGITFTPVISGIALATLGLVSAVALWSYVVSPALEAYQSLDAKVKEKSEQLKQQARIKQQIQEAKVQLTQVTQQRDQVLALFASERTLNTLLLDINQLIDRNNAGRLAARQAKLNNCPAWVRNQPSQVEEKAGPLVAEAKLKKFTPDEKGTQIITDSSLGAAINNKLKRQTIDVEFSGNFNQTQSIFRTIERLQPLLLLKNLKIEVGDSTRGTAPGGLYEVAPGGVVRFLTNCQPDSQITTAFQMEALLPLTAADKKTLQATPSPTASPK
jgi:type IV pilus assembly protein PilO